MVRDDRDAALAMPKSMILTSPSYDTSTFCGEQSRWTISSGRPSASFLRWA